MVRFSSVGTTLALAASVLGTPAPITPDPNGAAHVGNGKGEQFITGACLSTADCGQTVVSACCAFIAGGTSATGICSGTAVANTNGKAGCGFGDPPGTGSAASAAPAPAASEAPPAAAPSNIPSASDAGQAVCTIEELLPGTQNVGTGAGTQFITGQCFSKADCASGCCVQQESGPSLCKAVLVTQEAGKSCDFSCSGNSAAPATAQANAAPAAAAAEPAPAAADSGSSGSCAVNSALAGSQNVGTGAAAQFITGQCFSKADCASGCCVAQADSTAQCKAVLVTQQAGKSCDFSCTPGGSAPAVPAAAAAAPPAAAAAAPPASGSCSVNQDLAGNQNVGKGTASQFITGQCFSDGDCASGCCVGQASGTALCKAKLVTQQAGLSCGFTCAA